MKLIFLIPFLFIYSFTWGNNDKYRLILTDDPATTITIAWNQISGNNPIVHYGTTDYGTNWISYPNSKTVSRSISYRGMNNQFARLSNLSSNTTYYFVIKDSQGTSQRYWFKTAPNDLSRLSFIAGGDSRNNRLPRQRANKLVAKLKPHAVFFGGDMTDGDNDLQWQEWFEDWQLTIATDGRMFPIIPIRGNHEGTSTIYNLFDTPTSDSYYALTFGNNLIRMYSLNSEISVTGNQNTWLNSDLQSNSNVIWKGAQYHKPMRPHNAAKSEGNHVYNAWAQTFYDNEVRLVVDCDSHTVKSTWPIKPSTAPGNDEGFVRDDTNGTIYLGEGCWGAPLRSNNDDKTWTRNSGSFNQFKLIFVDANKIEARTIKVDNADTVGSVSNTNPFVLPTNLDVWNPSNGAIVEILKDTYQTPPNIEISNINNGDCFESGDNITISVDINQSVSNINNMQLFVNNIFIDEITQSPYNFSHNFNSGINTVLVIATDQNNNTASSEKYIFIGNFTDNINLSILTGDDDVEEAQDGRLYTDSSDLEIVYDSYDNLFYQTIGLRFVNLKIPKGATINSAYIQFSVDEINSYNSEFLISVEDDENATEYVESLSFGVSSRIYFSQPIYWSPNPWITIDESSLDQQTPSLKNLVQYIVSKSNWELGNSIAFKITGTGISSTNPNSKRVANSFEGGASYSPKLIINYSYNCTSLLSNTYESTNNLTVFVNSNDKIEIKSLEKINEIQVYDLKGRKIFHSDELQLNQYIINHLDRKKQIILLKIININKKEKTIKMHY